MKLQLLKATALALLQVVAVQSADADVSEKSIKEVAVSNMIETELDRTIVLLEGETTDIPWPFRSQTHRPTPPPSYSPPPQTSP